MATMTAGGLLSVGVWLQRCETVTAPVRWIAKPLERKEAESVEVLEMSAVHEKQEANYAKYFWKHGKLVSWKGRSFTSHIKMIETRARRTIRSSRRSKRNSGKPKTSKVKSKSKPKCANRDSIKPVTTKRHPKATRAAHSNGSAARASPVDATGVVLNHAGTVARDPVNHEDTVSRDVINHADTVSRDVINHADDTVRLTRSRKRQRDEVPEKVTCPSPQINIPKRRRRIKKLASTFPESTAKPRITRSTAKLADSASETARSTSLLSSESVKSVMSQQSPPNASPPKQKVIVLSPPRSQSRSPPRSSPQSSP
eukprot:377505_1